MIGIARRRQFKVAAVAALVAAVPLLSSCSLSGFDYATDRPNVIANGGYKVHGSPRVLAARIIAPSHGAGTFVATIATDATAEPATLVGLSGVSTSNFTPIEVATGEAVNLYTAGGIGVSGDFTAGNVVPVTLSFADGQEIKVNAIVVTQCHEYSDPAGAAESDADEAYACDYAEAPADAEHH